jgi:hypothetical protein
VQVDSHARAFIRDAEERLVQLSDQQMAIGEFSSTLHALLSVDSTVSLDESDLYLRG